MELMLSQLGQDLVVNWICCRARFNNPEVLNPHLKVANKVLNLGVGLMLELVHHLLSISIVAVVGFFLKNRLENGYVVLDVWSGGRLSVLECWETLSISRINFVAVIVSKA